MFAVIWIVFGHVLICLWSCYRDRWRSWRSRAAQEVLRTAQNPHPPSKAPAAAPHPTTSAVVCTHSHYDVVYCCLLELTKNSTLTIWPPEILFEDIVNTIRLGESQRTEQCLEVLKWSHEPSSWMHLPLWHHKGQMVQHYTLFEKWKVTEPNERRTQWLLTLLFLCCHCFQVAHILQFGICRVNCTIKEAPRGKAVASKPPPRPPAAHRHAKPRGPPPLSPPHHLLLPSAQRRDLLTNDFFQPYPALRRLLETPQTWIAQM